MGTRASLITYATKESGTWEFHTELVEEFTVNWVSQKAEEIRTRAGIEKFIIINEILIDADQIGLEALADCFTPRRSAS